MNYKFDKTRLQVSYENMTIALCESECLASISRTFTQDGFKVTLTVSKKAD